MFDEQIKTGFVTIIGRPNAGKSTLLNNILKQKIAIMSDKPQTTRNIINALSLVKRKIPLEIEDVRSLHE